MGMSKIIDAFERFTGSTSTSTSSSNGMLIKGKTVLGEEYQFKVESDGTLVVVTQ